MSLGRQLELLTWTAASKDPSRYRPLASAGPAASRRSDPPTSRQAADGVERSGRAAQQREAVLSRIRGRHGQTSAEVAAALGMERHAPARRLPELREAGLVRMGVPRVCEVTGRQCVTWWPA